MFIYSLYLYICLVFPMYFFNMYIMKVEKKITKSTLKMRKYYLFILLFWCIF